VRFRFALRELEQVERALDVDRVRRDGRELGARGQDRGEVEDQLDLELREHALERAAIEDRAGDLAVHLRRNRRIQAGDIERHDRAMRLAGEPVDETVADLASGAGYEHDGFPHSANYTGPTMTIWMALLALAGLLPQPSDPFDFGRTMRVDYFHTGGPKSGETVALDRVVNDGPWPGSRRRLVDGTNLGKYLFEVQDKASGHLLYSRGFASIYGEWETTPEVRTAHRTFHESMRFPWPRQPVQVTLKKRQADNGFAAIWSGDVDPGSRFVNSATLPDRAGIVATLFEHGPAHRRWTSL
jgi:hypothetical protein